MQAQGSIKHDIVSDESNNSIHKRPRLNELSHTQFSSEGCFYGFPKADGMKFNCLECEQSFVSESAFCCHLLVEHEIPNPTEYLEINRLQCHIPDVVEELASPILPDEKENQCEVCGKLFINPTDLGIHIKEHNTAFQVLPKSEVMEYSCLTSSSSSPVEENESAESNEQNANERNLVLEDRKFLLKAFFEKVEMAYILEEQDFLLGFPVGDGMQYHCNKCKDRFLSKDAFGCHLLLEHDIHKPTEYIELNRVECHRPVVAEVLPNSVEIYEEEKQCEVCSNMFKNSTELDIHFKVHGSAYIKKLLRLQKQKNKLIRLGKGLWIIQITVKKQEEPRYYCLRSSSKRKLK